MSTSTIVKIDTLKKRLVSRAEEVQLNLQHPEVQMLSQKLDELIVMAMQNK